MNREIRIVIADDHPLFRSGLRMAIEADPLLRVVGEAGDGESALGCILELQPDVVVLDINMPPPDGLAIARDLQERHSPVKAIFLTMHRDKSLLNAALETGVKGFMVKDAAANEIVGCIKAVVVGESYVSPALSGHLIKQNSTAQSPLLGKLSASERRVLQLVAEFKTNKEIAEQLFISIRTVEHHRSNICTKLGLTGKNTLLNFALTYKSEL